MAEVEITHEEVRGIDINQVASMQLKDGTVVIVNSEATIEDQGEFAQEEVAQEECDQAGVENVEQENQLRARPMVGMPYGARPVVPVRPAVAPMRPAVVPVRPAVVPGRPMAVPKPVPRGPVVRPGMPMGGVVFRARPGMPMHMAPPRMAVPPRPVVPVRPGVPAMRPVVPGPMMPKPVPVRPIAPVGPKPLVNQIITGPRVFRARPNTNEEEDFQQENEGEVDYCECEDYQGAGEENQLRARPLVVPGPMTYGPAVVRPQVHHPVHRPPIVPPPRVAPLPVKRGPAVFRPGYNTFQPGVFRARPRMVVPRPAMPMFTPVAPGLGVRRVVRPMPPQPRPYGFGMGPVFRNRPTTTEYDGQEQEYAEEYVEQYDTEGCDKSCVCTKCGKEF